MRAWLMAGLMVAVALSGCATSEEPVSQTTTPDEIQGIAIGNITETAESLVFEAASLPFSETFELPEGVTMVRFTADPLDAGSISVAMSNAETGRRRCNQQPVVGFGQSLLGERSCSSITAMDLPGTEWEARASGNGKADVRIDFFTTPVDGVAGLLNLTELSKATYELEPTEYLTVPSFDGTPLWVEVTKPKGEGPWPAIIASSPYNGETGRGEVPAMWTYWTQDWAKRGYVAVNVDVRGYGMSGGCVEVWGEREQRDQAYIVDWVAGRPWSDGNVGFYGQSYVGTTPVAAAVQAPEGLKAIIAVAPVINSYEDWHYGGVPNGEGVLSPVAYQVLTAAPAPPSTSGRTDLESLVRDATSGVCDPSLLPRANGPTAEYNEFYEERDFKKRAGNVKAAVLFTEGFEDANVKSAMIPGWFNELQSPKLGVFGHWLHQHPARMDQEALFLGWMDQYVKGKDIGFDRIPAAVINAEDDLHRTAEAWPPLEEPVEYGADLSAGALVAGEGKGTMMVDLDPTPSASVGPVSTGAVTVTNEEVRLTMSVNASLPIVAPQLRIAGTLNGENGFVHADLYEVSEDGTRLLTWGRMNLALRNGYDSYEPLTPAAPFTADLPFRPVEHVVEAGSTLELRIRGVVAGEAVGMAQPQPGILSLDGSGTALLLPPVDMADYTAMPISARP